MDITIEKIPPYRIAYIRRVGPYGNNNVQTMEEIKKWARANHLFDEETVILGIAQDNPKITEPENCRYDTCVVVSNNFSSNDDFVNIGNIVGGKYAVFKIDHTAEAVQKAWIEIFPELSEKGYQFDNTRPIIERYAVKMINNHFCEICVPVNENNN